jgi:hypothetical protein
MQSVTLTPSEKLPPEDAYRIIDLARSIATTDRTAALHLRAITVAIELAHFHHRCAAYIVGSPAGGDLAATYHSRCASAAESLADLTLHFLDAHLDARIRAASQP